MTKMDIREQIIEIIGYRFGALVSGNNQPHMSGDPRARIVGARRRQFDDACADCADGILGALRDRQTPGEGLHTAWDQLGILRGPEGNSVTLICDNPDFNGQPNNAVIVCGDWTDWEEKRFHGETIFDAIDAAYKASLVCNKEAP